MADILLNSIEGSGGGGLIMPIRVFANNSIYIKNNTNGLERSDAVGFYALLESNYSGTGKGFDISTAILSGSSEQTVVDISGEGVLTNVLSQSPGSFSSITIKVTIDGEEYVFTKNLPGQLDKIALGDVFDGGVSISSAASITYAGSLDSGFVNSTSTDVSLLTPEQVLNRRLCGMVFKESLKVTMQASNGFVGGGSSNKACVFYTTYIPEGL